MNIEICMTLTGSVIILFYLMLKPWKGEYISAVHYQWVLRIALIFYILPFQMVKYPVRNALKSLNLGKLDAGVYHYSNLEYKYINKAFYYSETFHRELKLFIGSPQLDSCCYWQHSNTFGSKGWQAQWNP